MMMVIITIVFVIVTIIIIISLITNVIIITTIIIIIINLIIIETDKPDLESIGEFGWCSLVVQFAGEKYQKKIKKSLIIEGHLYICSKN